MKNSQLLISFLILLSCDNNQLPSNSRIIAKYIVFNEKISPQLNVCPDSIKSFKEKNYRCIFRLGNDIFEEEYVVRLNRNGNMENYVSHSVSDDIDYKKFNIEPDKWIPEDLNAKDFWIRLSESRDKVIDGKDTLAIVKIFESEKLLFVESKSEKKGRRFIYEYN